MKRFIFFFFFFLMGAQQWASAQKISYSPLIKEDNQDINFEILGKIGNNYVVYKKVRWKHMLQVFNTDMTQRSNERMSYIPDKVLNVDFVTYPDHFYMIFQYQRNSNVFCKAVKINSEGERISEVMMLDSTRVGLLNDSRIYNLSYSEDKQKILLYKLHKKSGDLNIVTKRYDAELNQLDSLRQTLDFNERRDVYSDFQISDKGTIVFAHQRKAGNRENINNLEVVTCRAGDTGFVPHPIALNGNYIDEVQIKIDNVNDNFLINSLYFTEKRGSVVGLFATILNSSDLQTKLVFLNFSDSIRNKISNSGEYRYAFDNIFIRNLFLKRDGGYILILEDFSSQNRGNNGWNRWDYLYGNPYGYSDYYMFNRYRQYGFYNPYYYGRNAFSSTRYYYDNLLVLGIDSSLSLNWEQIIFKKQADEDNDYFLSFTTMNSGAEIHFLFIEKERRAQVISNQSINSHGKITRYATLKSRENGYLYMPRLGKQVGIRQMIIPCLYRDNVSFAKIDFSEPN